MKLKSGWCCKNASGFFLWDAMCGALLIREIFVYLQKKNWKDVGNN